MIDFSDVDFIIAKGYVIVMTAGPVVLFVANLESYGMKIRPFKKLLNTYFFCYGCSLPAQHPCSLPCHAPSTCSEADPCRAIITLSCSCGRIRQSASCGRSISNPGCEAVQQLKCTNECLIAKRNAKLAEALGISTVGRETQVTYNDELIGFAKLNAKFLGLVEKSFAE